MGRRMETSSTLDPSELVICRERETDTIIMPRSVSLNQHKRMTYEQPAFARTLHSSVSSKGSYFSLEGSIFCGGTGTRNYNHRRGAAVSLQGNFLDSLVINLKPGSCETVNQSVRLRHQLIRNDMIRRGPLV